MVIQSVLHVCSVSIDEFEAPLKLNSLCSEATNGRALNSANYNDGSAMTDESCINFCNGKGYNLAGTEYSAECCKSQAL